MWMKGFHESGTPDDWDTAMGKVRGYRWWHLLVEYQHVGQNTCYTASTNTDLGYPKYPSYAEFQRELRDGLWNLSVTDPVSPWQPALSSASVSGMHGRMWARLQADKDGWYTADCAEYGGDATAYAVHKNLVPVHECGCGFWAYWKPEIYGSETTPHIQKSSQSYTVCVPLFGMIEGTGRTIIGEKGFRCRKAKITAVALNLEANTLYTDLDTAYSPFSTVAAGGIFASDLGFCDYPVREPLPVVSYLSRVIAVPEHEILGTLTWVLRNRIGDDVAVYSSVAELVGRTEPDGNYGE